MMVWTLWLAIAAGEIGPAQPAVALTETAAAAAARQDSPAARRALLTRDQTLGAVALQQPRLRPDLTLEAGGDLQTPTVRDPAAPHALVRRDLAGRVGLSAEQILLARGGDALDQRLRCQLAASQADCEAALAQAAAAARNAWLDLAAAKAGFAVADEGVRQAQDQLVRVQDLLAVERVADVDRLQAEAGVLEARAARVEAANGLALAAASLNRLLGADLDRPLVVELPTELPPALPDLAAATAYAVAHRPEVTALLARGGEARAGARLADAPLGPTLAATAGVVGRTPDAFDPGFDARLGFVLRWPLTRSDTSAALAGLEARGAARLADLSLAELRGGIALEVRKAWLDDQAARERLQLATARVAAAEEAHRVRVLQYERSRTTLLEVQAARLEVSRAKLEQANANLAVHRAVAAFELASAGYDGSKP
jgi:outer membrane protein